MIYCIYIFYSSQSVGHSIQLYIFLVRKFTLFENLAETGSNVQLSGYNQYFGYFKSENYPSCLRSKMQNTLL